MASTWDITRAKPRQRRVPAAVCVRRGGAWTGAALLAVGGLFAWQALRLDLGSVGMPGPGFVPLGLGIVLAALGVLIGAAALRTAATGDTVELGHRNVLVTLALLAAVCLGFEPLGAYATLGLFATAMLVLVAGVRLPFAVGAALIGMAAAWYFFTQLLGLRLPLGPF